MTILKDSKADVLNTRLAMVKQPVILPVLTTAERDALVDIQDGMMIINGSSNVFQVRVNNAWINFVIT